MSADDPSGWRDALFMRPHLRWPIRLFVAAAVALGVGLAFLSPGARPWLFGGFIVAAGFLAWSIWDDTRGRTATLDKLRARWLERADVVANGDDLHFTEDGQPLIARLASGARGPSLAILTPLRETTAAFRIASPTLAAPSFDGQDPPIGGPQLSPLPGLQLMLHDALKVEGNEPAQLERWLDRALVSALLRAASDHGDTFRGLTFDGRFLAVHWIGEVAIDPAMARALSAPLWRPFVPRLPPVSNELLN